jgi:serine O-acetyltransferase
MSMRFWDVVRADLEANAGHRDMRRLLPALLFNPGFDTIFRHRVASRLARGRLRRLGITVWRRNVLRSGCHINLASDIAPGVFLPHPVGIVIGEGARIGAGATIYQGVTVGKTASPRYPSVGERATLYPNAMVIGPVTVGADAVVGAAAVVLRDVPEGATVVGNPARIVGSVTEQVR